MALAAAVQGWAFSQMRITMDGLAWLGETRRRRQGRRAMLLTRAKKRGNDRASWFSWDLYLGSLRCPSSRAGGEIRRVRGVMLLEKEQTFMYSFVRSFVLSVLFLEDFRIEKCKRFVGVSPAIGEMGRRGKCALFICGCQVMRLMQRLFFHSTSSPPPPPTSPSLSIDISLSLSRALSFSIYVLRKSICMHVLSPLHYNADREMCSRPPPHPPTGHSQPVAARSLLIYKWCGTTQHVLSPPSNVQVINIENPGMRGLAAVGSGHPRELPLEAVKGPVAGGPPPGGGGNHHLSPLLLTLQPPAQRAQGVGRGERESCIGGGGGGGGYRKVVGMEVGGWEGGGGGKLLVKAISPVLCGKVQGKHVARRRQGYK